MCHFCAQSIQLKIRCLPNEFGNIITSDQTGSGKTSQPQSNVGPSVN